MKFNPVTLAAIGIFILLLVVAAVLMQPVFESPVVVASAPPLYKNSELQLQDGEVYSYSYITENSTMNITYSIQNGPGCMIINIVEAGASAVCLDQYGERVAGPNATFGDPTLLLFKPWMLALNNTWRWNSSIYLSFDDNQEHISDVHYRVIRREVYMDREAFVIELDSELGEKEYTWVDAEKRITLKIIGEGYEVLLN